MQAEIDVYLVPYITTNDKWPPESDRYSVVVARPSPSRASSRIRKPATYLFGLVQAEKPTSMEGT